ncbi:MAG TPA: hypothetical protein VK555_09945 [Terriglobales bacterium]|nr:hypothetical protein [Terriglobales bacterium]
MSQEKYIGMDVHQATISVAVMEGRGKLIMECILETKAAKPPGCILVEAEKLCTGPKKHPDLQPIQKIKFCR